MTSPATPSEKRPGLARKIQRWEIVALVLALFLVGAAAWNHWSEPGYVGTTRNITLRWSCPNEIFWSDDDRGGTWRATPEPKWFERSATDRSASNGPEPELSSTRQTFGSLHFDSRNRATFRSDTGGTMLMERQKKGTFDPNGCSIDASP